MGDRFGRVPDWPDSASHVAPYFTIIFQSLGLEEAEDFFGRARAAHHKEVARESSYPFDLIRYVSITLDVEWGQSFARRSAWEALKAIDHLVRVDPGVDFEQYIVCAIEACARVNDCLKKDLLDRQPTG